MQKYLTVSKKDLVHIPTPAPTKTWQPVAHSLVVQTVDDYLESQGIGVRRETLTVNAKGDKFFAQYTLDITFDGARLVLGFRNSSNKRFALGFVGGLLIMICTNGQFSGDKFNEFRKHTPGLTVDYLKLFVANAVEEIRKNGQAQRKWHRSLADHNMTSDEMKVFAYDAMDQGALPGRFFGQYQDALEEEIKIADGVTLYTGHGAITRVHRQTAPHNMPEYSARLNDVVNLTLARKLHLDN